MHNNKTQMVTIWQLINLKIVAIRNLNTFDKKNEIFLDKPNKSNPQYFCISEERKYFSENKQ